MNERGREGRKRNENGSGREGERNRKIEGGGREREIIRTDTCNRRT